MGRDLNRTIIVDNIAENYLLQPENGVCIKSWYDDPNDDELMSFVPALKMLADPRIADVRPLIMQSVVDNEWHPDYCLQLCENIV